ncbi:MAG: tetratricopeptide repeat protein [Candidatus Cloacimonadota bacterium]|nr:tetratricopeptide repeat protein [Candidatus Cloacimonadota bacterium]
MKRKVILILTLAIMVVSVFANQESMVDTKQEKVAILELEQKDRQSDYVVKRLMERDFEKLFDEHSNLKLIEQKEIEKVLEETGYTNISGLGKERLAELGEKLDADYLVWGSVEAESSTLFKIRMRVYSIRAESVSALNFTTKKDTDSRRKNVEENLLNRLERMISEEIQEAVNIAMQYFNSRDYDSAKGAFERVLSIEPTNVMAYFYLGYISYYNRNYEEAEDYYLRALDLDPQNLDILTQLKRTYEKQYKYDETLEILHKISELSESKETWLEIGKTYTKIEYYDDAAEAFHTAIELDDEYGDAYRELGLMYYDLENYNKALEPLEEAVKLFPDDEDLSRKLGRCYLRTGKLDSAVEQYKSLIEEQPNNTRAYMNLANAYNSLNEHEKSVQTLLKLKEIDPDNISVYINLANSHIFLENYTEAEKNANIAKEKDPENHRPYMLLARLYQKTGYQKYENYLTLEEQAKEAYGEEADRLVEERDTQRDAAHSDFQKSMQYLQEAKKRTDSSSVMRDINSREELLNQLLEATKRGFF